MCLSFFQIKDLGQSRSKSAFSQIDTYLEFLFLFPSVFLSYQLNAKFQMYFAQPFFCIFEWCAMLDEPNHFPELEILKLRHLKGLNSCLVRS